MADAMMTQFPFGAPSAASAPRGMIHHPRTRAPLTAEEADWARCRLPHERTPVATLPKVGDRIGVRLHENGPVYAAVVVRTVSTTEPFPGYRDGVWPPPTPRDVPDPNVWRVVVDDSRKPVRRPDGHDGYHYELVDDPWPDVEVRIDSPVDGRGRARVKRPRIFTVLREERLTGLGGWLRADRIDDEAENAVPEIRKA